MIAKPSDTQDLFPIAYTFPAGGSAVWSTVERGTTQQDAEARFQRVNPHCAVVLTGADGRRKEGGAS